MRSISFGLISKTFRSFCAILRQTSQLWVILRPFRYEAAMICAPPADRGEKRGPLTGFALNAGAIAAVALIWSQAFGQQAIAPPEVTASSVFVLNADTGQPLYRKNENKAFRILSIKIDHRLCPYAAPGRAAFRHRYNHPG
jgi:hypothetical protein